MKYLYKPMMLLMALCVLLGLPFPMIALERPFTDSGPDSGAIALTAVIPPDKLPVMLPAGADAETIRNAFEAHYKHLYTVCAQTIHGDFVECAVEFDFSEIAAPVWGPGTLSGTVIPPAGYRLGDGVGYRLPYRALKPYRIDLSYFTEQNGDLFFRWPHAVSQPEKLRLSYGIEGQGRFSIDKSGHYGRVTAASLLLYRDRLEPGVQYYFRVGCEGLYSNTVAVSVENGAITARPSSVFPDVKPDFGDQDGGDREEQYIPPVTQPITPAREDPSASSGSVASGGAASENISQILAPKPSKTPDSLAETTLTGDAARTDIAGKPVTLPAENPAPLAPQPPITERVTQDSTILSGYRLRRMLETNNSVSLEKYGILIQLPQTFFDGLNMEDEDLFACTIKKNTDASFSLELALSGHPVTQLPPSTVQFPLPERLLNELLTIYDSNDSILEGTIPPDQPRVIFEITGTGTYRIEAAEALQAAVRYPDTTSHLSADPFPAIPGPVYGIVGFAVLCAAWILWERKRR